MYIYSADQKSTHLLYYATDSLLLFTIWNNYFIFFVQITPVLSKETHVPFKFDYKHNYKYRVEMNTNDITRKWRKSFISFLNVQYTIYKEK